MTVAKAKKQALEAGGKRPVWTIAAAKKLGTLLKGFEGAAEVTAVEETECTAKEGGGERVAGCSLGRVL